MVTQPLCLYCGKKIPKRTRSIVFGCDRPQDNEHWTTDRTERPKSIEEIRRLTNQDVVSIRWWTRDVWDGEIWRRTPEYIRVAFTWDGESYIDQFFCNGDHARRFAYLAARAGFTKPARRDQ